jgi:hypothetical protein
MRKGVAMKKRIIRFRFPVAAFLLAVAGGCSACPDASSGDAGEASAGDAGGTGDCVFDSDCLPDEVCLESSCVPEGLDDAGTVDEQDAGFSDAGPTGGSNMDAGSGNVAIGVSITQPVNYSGFFVDEAIAFNGHVTSPSIPFSELSVAWSSSQSGAFEATFDTLSGITTAAVSELPEGHHTIRLRVEHGTDVVAEASMELTICLASISTEFADPLDSDEWFQYGSAYHDSRGWLEMTGFSPSENGAIYYLARKVNPGDVNLTFKISTGKCDDPGACTNGSEGADGFAMSIFEQETESDLIDLITNYSRGGGGMGYFLAPEAPPVAAFHLEFDTYYNSIPPHEHQDPTTDDHVQVHMNGNQDNDLDPDPDNEVTLWAAMPNLEDNMWHDVEINIAGPHIQVTVDGVEIINGMVPTFSFKGGFIGFSGSTGTVYNYHRFDDLQIRDVCIHQPQTGDAGN